MTEFGKAIRILRIENNRRQKQDAEDFGATASYISAIEHGKKQVSDSYLEYCIKTYGNEDRLTELAEKQNQSTEKIAVIRCRDCQYSRVVDGEMYCDITYSSYYGHALDVEADDYCSRGERKEE